MIFTVVLACMVGLASPAPELETCCTSGGWPAGRELGASDWLASSCWVLPLCPCSEPWLSFGTRHGLVGQFSAYFVFYRNVRRQCGEAVSLRCKVCLSMKVQATAAPLPGCNEAALACSSASPFSCPCLPVCRRRTRLPPR